MIKILTDVFNLKNIILDTEVESYPSLFLWKAVNKTTE